MSLRKRGRRGRIWPRGSRWRLRCRRVPDIYVTQYGKNILYHNNGDGTFTDVTEKAGVAATGWSSSAVWFDYDNDGRLDLFVCRFVDFDKSKNLPCTAANKVAIAFLIFTNQWPVGCFITTAMELLPMFSQTSGIGKYLGKAWGVVATDINNDGRMDLFVSKR